MPAVVVGLTVRGPGCGWLGMGGAGVAAEGSRLLPCPSQPPRVAWRPADRSRHTEVFRARFRKATNSQVEQFGCDTLAQTVDFGGHITGRQAKNIVSVSHERGQLLSFFGADW